MKNEDNDMMFCVLGTGSHGNCIYVSDGRTNLLVDAGLSLRVLTERLACAGVQLNDIHAVLISHDHRDHYQGISGIIKANAHIEIFANAGTMEGIQQTFPHASFKWNLFETSFPFQIGTMGVKPFSIPHNAADPVGFIITVQNRVLGIVTDLGYMAPHILSELENCHALILESNYDREMLMTSSRPWSVQCRIAGPRGHLSNEAAAEGVKSMNLRFLHTLLLAHISDDCNTCFLAHSCMSKALADGDLKNVTLSTVSQGEMSRFYEV